MQGAEGRPKIRPPECSCQTAGATELKPCALAEPVETSLSLFPAAESDFKLLLEGPPKSHFFDRSGQKDYIFFDVVLPVACKLSFVSYSEVSSKCGYTNSRYWGLSAPPQLFGPKFLLSAICGPISMRFGAFDRSRRPVTKPRLSIRDSAPSVEELGDSTLLSRFDRSNSARVVVQWESLIVPWENQLDFEATFIDNGWPDRDQTPGTYSTLVVYRLLVSQGSYL